MKINFDTHAWPEFMAKDLQLSPLNVITNVILKNISYEGRLFEVNIFPLINNVHRP